MARHGITYEIRLYANYSIEAESRFDAVEAGGRLVFSDGFLYGKLLKDLLDDEQIGDAINSMRVYSNPDDRDGEVGELIDPSDYAKE